MTICLYQVSHIYVHVQMWSVLTDQHPLKSKGLPVVLLPLLLYTDDTSGNQSKKWNKFDVWYLLLAGLPWKENSKFENIHFLTCSNKISALEMSRPIVSDLIKLEKEGIITYDAYSQQNVLVVAPVLGSLADNPRAAELTNHMGSSARKYCWKCLVGPVVCISICTHNLP